MRQTLAFLLALPLFACAPSPETVCGHVADIVSSEDPGSSFDLAPCVEEADRRRAHDGAAYEREAGCIMAAESMSAISECRGK